MRRVTVVSTAMVVVGCVGKGSRPADSGAAKAATADTGMPMTTMPARATGSGAMVEQMRAHLQMMRALNADSLRAAMPMYQQMTDGMLAQMTKEMMDMKMPSDPRWSALMDSVHRDLNAMRGMSGPDLERAMPAHTARVTRLMAMHQSMMQPKRGQ